LAQNIAKQMPFEILQTTIRRKPPPIQNCQRPTHDVQATKSFDWIN